MILAVGLAAGVAACGGGDKTTGPGGTDVVNLDLAVGQSQVVSPDGNVLHLQIPSSSSGAEYRMAFENTGTAAGAITAMRVVAASSGASASVRAAGSVRSPFVSTGGAADLSSSRLREWRDQTELRLRANIRRTLERYRPEPARPRAGRTAAGALIGGTPTAGDTLRFNFPIDGQSLRIVPCDSAAPDTITAVVQRVSNRAIFVADTANPDNFSSTDYDQLADEFDNYIFAVDSAYFGAPADIDGNGHVIVLFSKRVNALTKTTDQTFTGGFFVPTDLARSSASSSSGSQSAGLCRHSNEAELLYLLAPDPNGDYGPQFSVSFAKENARSVSSHEFQHLLSAEDRVIKQDGTFNDLQTTWLDEGMSHVAEELVGLKAGGHGVRQNLTFADVTGSESAPIGANQTQSDVFNTFFLDNAGRLARYFLSPNTTQALATTDPGDTASLKMRGFAYIFLRWLGDQYGPSGSGVIPGSMEQELFHRIATGGAGLQTGVDDILGALSDVAGDNSTWPQLLANYSIMPDVDDIGVTLQSDRQGLPSWNLRDLYANLSDGSHWQGGTPPPEFQQQYPLAVTTHGFSADTLSFDVRAGTARYFEFSGSGAVPAFTLTLSDPSGSALSASSGAQVTVVRTH